MANEAPLTMLTAHAQNSLRQQVDAFAFPQKEFAVIAVAFYIGMSESPVISLIIRYLGWRLGYLNIFPNGFHKETTY